MDKELIRKGKDIVKVASSDRISSLIQNDISSRFASNVPTASASAIDRIIATQNHEIYGSVAQKSHSYAGRTPNDLDVAVSDPRSTACRILNDFQKKGIPSKVEPQKSPNSFNVQTKKNGNWVKAVDIHDLNTHSRTDIFGSSMPPERIGRFNVQGVRDQLLRKSSYIFTHVDTQTKRTLKDETDFVNLSNLRLREKKLQAEAELQRVQKARKDLQGVKQHVRKHNGWNARDYPLSQNPIPERQEQKFIKYAVKHPEKDVRQIILRNDNVVSNSTQKKKRKSKSIFDINIAAIERANAYWMQ